MVTKSSQITIARVFKKCYVTGCLHIPLNKFRENSFVIYSYYNNIELIDFIVIIE